MHHTERLIFFPICLEHEADLFELHNDPLVRETIFKNKPQSAEDVSSWLDRYLAQWRKQDFGTWMVYEKANGDARFIGRCGVREYEGTNNLEFAYAFFQLRAGQGLGPEAARFVITHALKNSSKEKIVGFIDHGNARAQRAAEKLGLRFIDDRWYYGRMCKYYEMTREEYFSQPHHRTDL
ncbi:GNAT family N-acetyltransferase [Bradyrhizobium sp. 153]|uniref:GNAT family N-acetyltransferase n=1 Tax=Bradyrhizobium sp. 153 TaxID=2782627 RepID=UPI001FF846FC|nr:GNAT family N-acetyltransferase [Bradyrhizobium sp. 153]MCK1665854.1 GNAT family N-acetyltransferase [Bradyrhizobium sp. 153]